MADQADHRALSRRSFLKSSAATASAGVITSSFYINHAWSQDVQWDGQPFDANGETLRLNDWGGFWEDEQRKALIDAFERTYNCKVAYDSAFPWFVQYEATGPRDPAHDCGNWNLDQLIRLNRVGDFFLSSDELRANVPNAQDVWPFAFGSGLGITWGFGQFAYAYRTDLVTPAPTGFKDFWRDSLAGKRGTYVPSNSLQQVFFMTSAAEWGKDQFDVEAGYDAMRRAMPLKLTDFSGNMETLVASGEVAIGVQWEGEVFRQMDKGIPVAPVFWAEKPILTQTQTVSRYSAPVQKKLALAYVNARLDAAYQTAMADTFYVRPSNKNVLLPERLTERGIRNDADVMNDLWIPDWNWYLDNENDIEKTVTGIFAG